MRTLTKLALLLGLFAPTVAFAAYNDVTLTTDVTLSVNSVTVNISGSSATLESIVVSDTTFTMSLQAGSSVTITAPNRNIMSPTVTSGVSSTETCTNDTSSLALTATQGSTVTIAPQSTLCTTPSSGSSGSGSSGGNGAPVGGGGGGGGGAILPSTPASTPASTPTYSNPAPASSGMGIVAKLTLALKKGSTGAQVKALQQMLNMDADTQIALSGAGSPGKETTLFGNATLAAIKKFQLKWGIAKLGDSGYGSLGPKTRAKLNALYGY